MGFPIGSDANSLVTSRCSDPIGHGSDLQISDRVFLSSKPRQASRLQFEVIWTISSLERESGEKMDDRDFDDILKTVATDIQDDSAIEELGKALGFRLGEISTFLKTNMRYGEVTNRGTLQMLRKWQQNVSKAEERSLLRQKLIEAGLRRVADDHLPKIAQTTSQAATPSMRIRQGSYVTESQIFKLSMLIPPSSYMDLAVVLGFGFAEFEAIMARNMSDTMKATVELLNTWKTRTRGRTDELDQALITAICGGVIEQYKQ
ncbi:uncharacterized protein [Diadema antillarum]|uniref:uncharacterized protein n=1 Tax=Diadema antillarum TaxID=105358 RepID=UPI003A8A1E42